MERVVGSSIGESDNINMGAINETTGLSVQGNESVGETMASLYSAADEANRLAQQLSEEASAKTVKASSVVVDATNSLSKSASAVTSQLSDGVGSAVATAESVLSSMESEATSIVHDTQENVSSIVGTVQTNISGAAEVVAGAVLDKTNAAVDALPPSLRAALQTTTAAAGDVLHRIISDPALGKLSIALGVGVPVVLVWNSLYGGFAGVVSPVKALEMLKSEADFVLVDIRSANERESRGVPQLKKRARGRGIIVPPVSLPQYLTRRIRNPKELATEMLGAEVASLKVVGPGTNVIILDERGKGAKAVARAASRAGVRRAFIVDGGFRKWTADKLPIDEKASEYNENPLVIIEDAAEAVAEEASSAIKSPTKAITLGTAATVAIGALVNYHVLLQAIGVIGVEATIVWKLLQYESPEAFLDDVGGQLSKLEGLISRTKSNSSSQQQKTLQQEEILREGEAMDQIPTS